MTSPGGEVFARLRAELVPDPTGFRQKTQRIVDATEDSIEGIDVPLTPELAGSASRIIGEVRAIARAAATDIPIGLDVSGADAGALATSQLGSILGGVKQAFDDLDFSRGLRGEIQFVRSATRIREQVAELLPSFASVADSIEKIEGRIRQVDFGSAVDADEIQRVAENLDRLKAPALPEIAEDLEESSRRARELATRVDVLQESLGQLGRVRTFEFFSPSSVADLDHVAANIRNMVLPTETARFFDRGEIAAIADRVAAMADSFGAINTQLRQMSTPAALDRDEIEAVTRNVREAFGDVRELEISTRLDQDSLRAVRRQIINFVSGGQFVPNQVQIRPQVVPQVNSATILQTANQVARLFRAVNVPIIPVVNNAAVRLAGVQLARLSGARVVTDEIEKMYRAFRNLDRALPTISLLSTGILGLVGYLATATSNVFALGASLAQIAPLALALPALFSGVAISIGVLIAAFKDFQTIFPGVSAELAALQDRVSANFWDRARASVQSFLDAPWQDFQAGIADTSSALGSFIGTLSASLAEGLNVAPMFAALNSGISILEDAAEPLTNIVQILSEAGSSIIPLLADKFVQLTETFSAWLSSQGVAGLAAMFEQAIFLAGELFRAFGGLGNILLGISSAATAAGGSTLTMIADTLDRIAEAVNSPVFQYTLTNFFAAAHEAMSNIAEVAGPAVENMFLKLAQTVAAVLPQVGTTIGVVFEAIASALPDPRFLSGFVAFIDGIGEGLRAFAPALGPVAVGLAELGTFVGEFASVLGPVLGTVFTVLAESLTGIMPALVPIIQVLGGALMDVAKSLAPVIAQLANAFALVISNGALPLISSLIGTLVPIIQQLAPIIANVLLVALNALVPLFPVITSLLTQIVSIVGGVLLAILPSLAPVLESLISVIVLVVKAIAPFLEIALKLIDLALRPLMPLINLLLQVALIPLEIAFAALAPVIELFGELLLWVVDNVIIPILMPAIETMSSFIESVLVPIISSIGDVFKAVWDFVSETFAAFKLLFQGDVDGFLRKIREAWDNFKTKALEIVVSLWNSIVTTFGEKLSAARDATREKLDEVRDFFVNLPTRILEALGNLRTLLVNAGKNIINGLLDGLKSAWSSVTSWLGGLGDQIVSLKGPPKADAVLLYDNGRLIIDSLLDGMESRYEAVKKSLRSFSGEIGETEFRTPTVMSGALTALASALSTEGNQGARIFNYYAAPGSSINSQEDLFAALGRGRAFGGF